MHGILLIDKPAGWSSFDVIRKLKGIFLATNPGVRPPKLGHAGTLDPMATGLMIVLVGDACKQADLFLKLDKSYSAEVTLGATSDTYDAEGEVVPTTGVAMLKLEQAQSALSTFVGQIQQVPPAHSAIKVGGQRAYALARKGKEVKLQPRQVEIYDITNVAYGWPMLTFDVSVSSGTYIRSLAHDIGQELGVGAYLSGLRRTSIDEYRVVDAVDIHEIKYEMLNALLLKK